MKVFLITALLFCSFKTFTQTRSDLNKVLVEIKKSGKFSDKEMKKVQKELDNLSDSQIKSLRDKAQESLSRPEVQKKIKSLKDKF